MIYLYVTPEGIVNLIEGDKMPADPTPHQGFGEAIKNIDALESAKASSVPVDDQERAKKIIARQINELNPNSSESTFMQPGVFYGPFDISVQWDWINPCIPAKKCLKSAESSCTPCKQNCEKIFRVALLKEAVGKLEEKEDDELKEKIEFIKGAFQCFVGFSTTERLEEFLKESRFTITRKH